MIFIFINPHFTFNGIYSKDMNVCIMTMNNDMFNEIGVVYSSNMEVETNLIEYSPYFVESPSDTDEIELSLLFCNPHTLEALTTDQYEMEKIYDWLITENFAPFISDDDDEIIYYFKVTKITKMLTFDKRGYLNISLKPYSKYCYKRKEYVKTITSQTNINIYNYSRLIYKPIIELTNLGDTSTINKINNMEVIGLKNNETISIDNLTKIVLDNQGKNKFNCCNAKWLELTPKVDNMITISGNCSIRIICEFPLIY